MKRNLWLMIGVLIVAAALRLYNLNARPLWYDEAFAILYAEKSLNAILSGTLVQAQGAAADVHPVAYYFLLHGWMSLVGQSPFGVRMLSVGCGVGTVALVYRLMRELFPARVARWSALAVALAPFQVAYSQEARMYALLGLWCTAALAAWVRAQKKSRWAWAAFVVCGALALYSHNLGFALFAGLGLAVIVRALQTKSWALVGQTALAGLGMTIVFAPWLAQVRSQFSKVAQAYWVTRPGGLALVQTLIAFVFDFENAVFPRGLLPFALFGALLVPALIIWQATTRRKAITSPSVALLAMLAILPVVIVFAISQWQPVYIIRGLIPAAIVYAALLGWAFGVMPRPARIVFGVPLVVLTASVLIAFYGYADFPRGPYVALDAFVRAHAQPGDVVLHSNKLTFFPAHVYDRTLPQAFLGDPPGSGSDTLARPTQEALGLFPTDLETATTNRSRIWFIIFRQAIAEWPGDHPHLAWLNERFVPFQTFVLGDVEIILFVRKPV